MGQLARAFGRFFSAMGLMFAGVFGRGTKKMLATPEAVEAGIDQAIGAEKRRYADFRVGVSMIVKNKKRDEMDLVVVTARLEQEERRLTGAKNIVEKEVKRQMSLGKTLEEAKASIPTSEIQLVREAYAAYTNLSGNITRDKAQKKDLEGRIEAAEKQVEDYRIQGQQINASIRDLERKKGDLLARLASATSRKQADEAMARVGTSGTAEILSSVEDIVAQAEAEAEVSSTMTGMDSERAMQKFDLAAENAEAHNALFAGMDFGDKAAESAATGTPAVKESSTQEDPLAQ